MTLPIQAASLNLTNCQAFAILSVLTVETSVNIPSEALVKQRRSIETARAIWLFFIDIFSTVTLFL